MSGDRPLLQRLHAEQEQILREQLQKLQAQATERAAISERLQTAINEELLVVGTAIIQLAPGPHAPESLEGRRDRLALQRDRQALTRESREEARSLWNDVQALETERRLVERELSNAEQRRTRLEDLLPR